MKYSLHGIETERLRFRKLKQDDFDWWMEFFQRYEYVQYLGLPNESPEKLCQRWFDKVFTRYKENTGGMHVLEIKDTGEAIGQCSVHIQVVDESEELEIGYSFLERANGNGYATEAAIKARDMAFENNWSDYLISIVDLENVRSANVALRNGMEFWKQTVFKGFDVNIFRITKERWSMS